jgi:hypothetical protein
MDPSTEASEQNHESAEEQKDQCSKNGPDARAKFGVRARSVVIHVVLDDAEEGEITGQSYHNDDECDGRHERCEDGPTDTRSEGKEEGDKGKSSSNWVEDHDTRESLCGVGGGSAKDRAIDLGHDLCWVVADVFTRAGVLVGAGWSNIEDAVAESAIGNSRMADVRSVGQSNLEKRDVVDDWCGDGRDQEEDGAGE